MEELISLLVGYFQNLNYASIITLMTVESSFIPLPSEIVMPPAGYLAAQGQLNIVLVIICGIVGSLLGALINYGIAFYLGRKIIYALVSTRWAKFLMLSPKKIAKATQTIIIALETIFLNLGFSFRKITAKIKAKTAPVPNVGKKARPTAKAIGRAKVYADPSSLITCKKR